MDERFDFIKNLSSQKKMKIGIEKCILVADLVFGKNYVKQ